MTEYEKGATKTFAEHLNLLMAQRGLSAASLAEKIGVDSSYIRRILAGSRVPVRTGPELIDRISIALRIDDEQRTLLMRSFSDALSKKIDRSFDTASDLSEMVSRILADTDTKYSTTDMATACQTWDFAGDFFISKSISSIIPEGFPCQDQDAYVYIPDNYGKLDDKINLFKILMEKFTHINHLVPDVTKNSNVANFLENIVRITSLENCGIENYRPNIIHTENIPGFLISKNILVLIYTTSNRNGKLLCIRTNNSRLCRLALNRVRHVYNSSYKFIHFFDETALGFQEKLFEIESVSSTRKGIFDEGLSFLTHPPHWYSDNSDFERKAPWQIMPPQEKRIYKKLLRQRLEDAADFLDIDEIVSEKGVLSYIMGTEDNREFYKEQFEFAQIEEHVHHIIEKLRNPSSRYRLYIEKERSPSIENKSWAAYDEYLFLDKVKGGNNMAMIVKSKAVAAGFDSIFELAKKRTLKKFPDQDAVADWLLARLSERRN